MKHLIIYHAHCNDGFGAAWAVYSSLKTNPEIQIILYPAGYDSKPPEELLTLDTVVHIVDFSYSPEIMIDICRKVNQVNWSDHHKTALDAWDQYEATDNYPENLNTNLSLSYSGALLAWRWYHPDDEPPILIKHINDRDLWKFEMEGTKEVHLNLNTYPKDINVWGKLIYDTEYSGHIYKAFIQAGEAINRYYRQLIQNILATNKVMVFIDGVAGLACNCPGALASDLGHLLANESGTYGLTWEETGKGTEKISLRSNGDYDVSSIAKSFGGGGHKNAAGFTLPVTGNEHSSRVRFAAL